MLEAANNCLQGNPCANCRLLFQNVSRGVVPKGLAKTAELCKSVQIVC